MAVVERVVDGRSGTQPAGKAFPRFLPGFRESHRGSGLEGDEARLCGPFETLGWWSGWMLLKLKRAPVVLPVRRCFLFLRNLLHPCVWL